MNICYNAVDRHLLEGRGDQVAVYFDSGITGTKEQLTFAQLHEQVNRLALALRSRGVKRGDRVLIYMPMIPAAVCAMLATARIGAIHVIVFGGFSGVEVARRLEDTKPVIVLTASVGLEPTHRVPYIPLLEDAFTRTERPPLGCLVFNRPLPAGIAASDAEVSSRHYDDWAQFVDRQCAGSIAQPRIDCEAMGAEDPLFILHTSGTTGTPKGLMRSHGPYAVALNASMEMVYAMPPNEGTWWAASDIGWIVGHSFGVYGPLVHGNSTLIFEGKPTTTPNAGVYGRLIEEYQVQCMFTAPTALRALCASDPAGELMRAYDFKRSLRAVFVAGERCPANTLRWARAVFERPVIDHYWMTESGFPIVANPFGIGASCVPEGSAGAAVPGYHVTVIDSHTGQPVQEHSKIGDVCLRLPLPPGFATSLWSQSGGHFAQKYLSSYPGWFDTADVGYFDEHGNLFVISRSDDVINVAGHRLSTGAIEEVLSKHDLVGECAVVGVPDDIKGEIPLAFIVVKTGSTDEPFSTIESTLISLVRKTIGPVATFKHCLQVARLPKTRSGKTLRKTLQHIYTNTEFTTPPTIEDPTVIDEIKSVVRAHTHHL